MARSDTQVKDIGIAVGWISEIFAALVAEVKKLGGTGKDWHRLTTLDGLETIKEIAKLITNPPPGVIRNMWSRPIDLGRKPGEILKAGGYAEIDDDIHRFPIDGRHGNGVVPFELFVIEFPEVGSPNTTENARERMEKRGLKPAGFAELLAFGEGIDDLVRKELGHEFQVVALATSVAGPTLSSTYAGIHVHGEEKRLFAEHDFPEQQWYSSVMFLAVRQPE